MKETRKLYSTDVRKLCIENKWYTKGTCDEYEKMFNYINSCEDFKTENIVYVAKDIKDHSDTEQDITSFCFELARICYCFFFEEEEEKKTFKPCKGQNCTPETCKEWKCNITDEKEPCEYSENKKDCSLCILAECVMNGK